jgi:hypothetical protein
MKKNFSFGGRKKTKEGVKTTLPIEQVIDALIMLGGKPKPSIQGACMETSVLLMYTLRELGFKAEALPVHILFFNDKWGTGTITGKNTIVEPAIKGLNYHLVNWLPDENVLIDGCAGQASRPDNGLILDAEVQAFRLNSSEETEQLIGGQTLFDQRGNGTLHYQVILPTPTEHLQANAWLGAIANFKEPAKIMSERIKLIVKHGYRAVRMDEL